MVHPVKHGQRKRSSKTLSIHRLNMTLKNTAFCALWLLQCGWKCKITPVFWLWLGNKVSLQCFLAMPESGWWRAVTKCDLHDVVQLCTVFFACHWKSGCAKCFLMFSSYLWICLNQNAWRHRCLSTCRRHSTEKWANLQQPQRAKASLYWQSYFRAHVSSTLRGSSKQKHRKKLKLRLPCRLAFVKLMVTMIVVIIIIIIIILIILIISYYHCYHYHHYHYYNNKYM